MSILKEGYSNSVTAEELPTIADKVDGISEKIAQLESRLKNGERSFEYYTAAGLRQFKKQFYKEALNCFEKAIALLPEDNTDGDVYFYAAVCLLNGSRPFLAQLPVIKKVEQYLNSALKFENKGVYYYLKYLIYSDYYEKKKLRCSPPSSELLAYAEKNNLSSNDKEHLRAILRFI